MKCHWPSTDDVDNDGGRRAANNERVCAKWMRVGV
jgi:hypothetical protein